MLPQSRIDQYNNLIITTAMKQGISQTVAKIMAAQAEHETAKYSSNNFIKNNNAFGMAVPRTRKSKYILGAGSVNAPAAEGGFSYARYASIEDSVKDLIDWFKYNNVNWSVVTTPENYDAFLVSKGYHTASQTSYTVALRSLYNDLKGFVVRNPKTSIAIAIAGAGLIGASIYLLVKKRAA
jgi:hypothetical protein